MRELLAASYKLFRGCTCRRALPPDHCGRPYPPAGALWLLGRAKDMIKSGGENVHAWEVERVLVDHPAVAAAAVVGVPHWRLGEAVAAAVVLAPAWTWVGWPCQSLLPAAGTVGLEPPAATGWQAVAPGGGRSVVRSIDARALQQHCRNAGLAGFKLPRVFLLCEPAGAAPRGDSCSVALHTLPVTTTGKPAKHALRALLAAEMAALEKVQAEQQAIVQHQPHARL